MITFIVEAIAFQLVFLLVYDLVLRRETFFNWNRTYLLGSFTASFALPLIKIDQLRDVIPQATIWKGIGLQNLNGVTLTASGQSEIPASIPWIPVFFVAGALVSLLLLCIKLRKLHLLKKRSVVQKVTGFTKIIVSNSSVAFSFFRNLFIGDRIKGISEQQIIAHERVHISEYHTVDLIYFEIMRVIQWFNPLVYLFQNRISELHEFIADNQVPLDGRVHQFNLLLSRAFETHKISFINQFFQSSLIKKRIVMLKKTRSQKVWKFKYLVLLPVVTLMLCYSSCQWEDEEPMDKTMKVQNVEQMSQDEEQELFKQLLTLSNSHSKWSFAVTDGKTTLRFYESEGDSYITGPNNERINAQMVMDGEVSENFSNSLIGASEPVPFGLVENVPVFPGCEDAADSRTCFIEHMQEHIRKNFKYPQGAIDLGIQGRVNILFTIDQSGMVTEIKKRGPHELLENEALRIIQKLPQMKPGMQRGEAVRVPFSIPITFKLKS